MGLVQKEKNVSFALSEFGAQNRCECPFGGSIVQAVTISPEPHAYATKVRQQLYSVYNSPSS